MRMRILASLAALLLVAGIATGASASDHRGAARHHGRHGHHFVGGDGRPVIGPAYRGHGAYTDLGPLGFTFGPPPGRSYCGPNCVPGASISAWSY
jgi:hypothetical protein